MADDRSLAFKQRAYGHYQAELADLEKVDVLLRDKSVDEIEETANLSAVMSGGK